VGSVLLAGDAAGVDPLLGEGISFALAYGEVVAEAIAAAFAQRRFDFADYPRRVRRHALLGQLPARASLARFRKRLKDSRLIGWLWRMTAATLRQTRWSDPDFVPARRLPPGTLRLIAAREDRGTAWDQRHRGTPEMEPGSRRAQVSDDETRDLVDEGFAFVHREDFRPTQDRSMRQCLHRGHTHECGEIHVGDPKLVAVGFEIRPHERMRFAIEGFHALESSRAWNLFGEDAMKLGIDAMCFDRDGDEASHHRFNRLPCNVRQRVADDLHDLPVVTIDDGGNERLLAG
jgi:hypothetical protein